MKKNNWTLLIFGLAGLFIGTLFSYAIVKWTGWGMFADFSTIMWQPKADFGFVAYDLHFDLRLNVGSLFGAVLGIWLFRRW